MWHVQVRNKLTDRVVLDEWHEEKWECEQDATDYIAEADYRPEHYETMLAEEFDVID